MGKERRYHGRAGAAVSMGLRGEPKTSTEKRIKRKISGTTTSDREVWGYEGMKTYPPSLRLLPSAIVSREGVVRH